MNDTNPIQNPKWYIIQVVSNHEANVKESLENKFLSNEASNIKKVFLPIVESYSKTKKLRQRSLLPGYLFVLATMTDETWYVIRNTQYVTGIVGSSGQRSKPTPISSKQIDKIIDKIKELSISNITDSKEATIAPSVTKVDFVKDDLVKVNDGSFAGQIGKVLIISFAKQTASVEIEFFGRMTEVEIELSALIKV